MTTFVIVGGGLAGAKAAETLRSEGFDGSVVIFNRESDLPYERPPLSKGYLLGKDPKESAYVHPASWYEEQRIDLRSGVTVTAIDRAAHVVATFEAGTMQYDKLLLATGASPRQLTIPGASAELKGVLYLRDFPDAGALRDA
ncbi:MAG TPA: FAD-dependent oxidoreductase, partial [Trebonia sp.]|nr:FAD-dependent oxidoreductase [Trebonia sp.]